MRIRLSKRRESADGLGGSKVTHDGYLTLPSIREGARRGRAATFRRAVAAVVVAAGLGGALPSPYCGAAWAQVTEAAPARHLTVTLYKSKTLQFNQPFTTAVIGSPNIADILPMTGTTLYIQGKQVGTTNVSVFDQNKRLVAVVDLEVTPDAATLHSDIVATTGDRNIKVSGTNGEVVLHGEASDAVSAAHAVDVARGLSPNAPVINAMSVAPSQQVMLKVRFLEVDRTVGRDLGVNFFGGNKNGVGFTGLGSVGSTATGSASTATSQTLNSSSTGAASGASTTTNNSATSIGGALFNGVFTGAAAGATPFGSLLAEVINTHGLRIDTLISALEAKSLVKSLAEPNLISQSGQPASFFAGAQVPIPTVQPGTTGTIPTVTVQFYSCGVTLNFTPTVLNTGLISMNLAPQVCEVSTTTPVVVNGTTIPELITRNANTTVELRDGQSFAIAGLLEAQATDQLSQLPWVGNVPVLGALFRSTNYQKNDTDLVVIVTVHLVRPVAAGKHLVTPFDTSLQANDVDLFLMGDTERKKKYTEFVTSGGGLQGPYGHILATPSDK
jgi:pilus assembly protein CpaC